MKKVIAILHDGRQIAGQLTTEHAASSYDRPVFVDDDGQAWDDWEIAEIREFE